MKYQRDLNNIRPCGKCSPCAAFIAFISIPFMALSLLSCWAIAISFSVTPLQNRFKISFATSTLIPSSIPYFPLQNKKEERRWREKANYTVPLGTEGGSETCLHGYTHLINAASAGITHTHGCSCRRLSGCFINLPGLAWNCPQNNTNFPSRATVLVK